MPGADNQASEALRLGRANIEVLALSANHCSHMEFVHMPGGGASMLEAASELPIAHRAVQCRHVAHGRRSYSSDFGAEAVEFYEKHCDGCAFRNPNGHFPTLGALVEQHREALRDDASRRDAEYRRALESREERRVRRSGLRSSDDPIARSIAADLDLMDPVPQLEPALDSAVLDSARARLEGLARRNHALMGDEAVDSLVDLARIAPQARALEPLRLLAQQRAPLRRRVLELALRRLSEEPDLDASRVLIDFRDQLISEDITPEVMTAIIWLAAQPLEEFSSAFEAGSARDTGPLGVVASRFPDLLLGALDDMLQGPPVGASLELAGDAPPPAIGEDLDSRYRRSAAGTAVQSLLGTHPELGQRAFPWLLRNLAVPDSDLDPAASSEVIEASAAIIAVDPDRIDEVLQTGRFGGIEYREALVHVLERVAVRLPEDPSAADALRDKLLATCFDLVGGTWGAQPGSLASSLTVTISREAPELAAKRIDAFVGAMLRAREAAQNAPEPSKLEIAGTAAYDEFHWGIEKQLDDTLRGTTLRNLHEAVVNAARMKPHSAVRALLAVLDVERDEDINPAVVADVLQCLGDIGELHAGQPGLATSILNALSGYLVDSNPYLQAKAIRSWTKVCRPLRVTGRLDDLLQTLIESGRVVIAEAIFEASVALEWSEPSRRRLFSFALRVASVDDQIETLKEKALIALLSLSGTLPDQERSRFEQFALECSLLLSEYHFRKVIERRAWSVETQRSRAFAAVRWRCWRLRRDPFPSRRDRDDDFLSDLLSLGSSLACIDSTTMVADARRNVLERPHRAELIVELIWRAHGWPAAAAAYRELLGVVPDQTRYRDRRMRLVLLAQAGEPVQTPEPLARSPLTEQSEAARGLITAVKLRARIRELLASPTDVDGMGAAAKQLEVEADRDTETAAYLKLAATLIRAAAHTCAVGLELRRAATSSADAHRVAAELLMSDVRQEVQDRWASDDALRAPLDIALDAFDETDWVSAERFIDAVSALPLPTLTIEPSRGDLESHVPIMEKPAAKDTREDVAVALVSLDGQLITGTQILRPMQPYRMEIQLDVAAGPEWASHLEVEIITDLSPREVTLPTMSWPKPAGSISSDGTRLIGEGSLICHFTLGHKSPAPSFFITARWRGVVEGREMVETLDIAAHREIRLRPFDAASDALTKNGPVDERLIAIFTQLRNHDIDETHVQAFARLLTAIARASLRLAWDPEFKRGTPTSEARFHDRIDQLLRDDPELGGRVERGAPSGGGFGDVRHDGITAELKVEKRTPMTKERSAKFIGQTTQYASSDGTRASILCILDVSTKRDVVAAAENYFWVLQPKLHGLEIPEDPSLVAVHVINTGSPSPSSRSRRRVPVEEPSDAGRPAS